ncbi:hypothetical protein SynRS9909_01772 [Synechococcus sp. RS9909]|nr:hypothetical protein SynRS9909_01418 [Synechococcus sp. RS9909]QNI79755.1 hypothetical protein SynRS9909_01772 [Synechococcus sp. RS9909]
MNRSFQGMNVSSAWGEGDDCWRHGTWIHGMLTLLHAESC